MRKETFIETGNLTVGELITRLKILPASQQVFVDGTGIGGLSYGESFVTIQTEDYHPEEHEADDDACTECGNRYVYEVDMFPEHARKYRTGYCSGERQVCAYCANGLTYGAEE